MVLLRLLEMSSNFSFGILCVVLVERKLNPGTLGDTRQNMSRPGSDL